MASLSTVFLVAAVIAFFGLLVALLLPERPLRETIAAAAESDIGGEIAQTFAMPTDTDSRKQLLRGLAVLADRDVRRRYIASIVARAGVDLSPTAAWLLVERPAMAWGLTLPSLGVDARCDKPGQPA